MSKRYDVLVIGGGVAGGVTARRCRKAGMRVAVAEGWKLGGTCPLRGCEPKKVLVDAAEAVCRVRSMRQAGVEGDVHIDWSTLMEFKKSFTEPVPDLVEKSYKSAGIDVLHGFARFTGPGEVAVAGETYEADAIVLAVGAKPRPLDIPGGELTVTSDDMLELKSVPETTIFLGGGFISFESAHVLARAGGKAVIVQRSTPLKQFDPGLVEKLCDSSRNLGIDVLLHAPLERIECSGSRYIVHTSSAKHPRVEGDLVVNATGRVPWLDGMDLEKGEVAFSDKGVKVDETLRSTTNPRVFAAGDVAGMGEALTPVGVLQADAVARTIISGEPTAPNHAGVPSACFASPQLAAVGMQEADAAKEYPSYTKYAGSADDWSEHERIGRTHTGYNILVDEERDMVLGAHLLMEDAEEVVNLFAMAIRHGLTVSQLKDTVWSYPSFGYAIRYMLDQ